MATSLVLNNLTKRRRYLAGEIAKVQQHLKDLRRESQTADNMIRLVDAKVDVGAIKGYPSALPDGRVPAGGAYAPDLGRAAQPGRTDAGERYRRANCWCEGH